MKSPSRRPKTKERYFTSTYRYGSQRVSTRRARSSKSNDRRTMTSVECPECGSMNCKQRIFDIKCYDCGVVIEGDA